METVEKVGRIMTQALDIMVQREAIYQGGWQKDTMHGNMRRASDKVARAASILANYNLNETPKGAFKDSAIDDLLDAMNYCAFTIACIRDADKNAS